MVGLAIRLLGAAVIIWACLMPGEAISRETDYVATGVTVTGSYSWKPYSFLDANGKPDGFFVEYWTRWSEKTGIPVRIKLVSWNESLEMVANGEADIQCGLFFTEERSKLFDFSNPIYHARSVTVLGEGLDCGDESARLKWGGVKGTVEVAAIRRLHPDAKVVEYADSFALLEAMERGEIQAIINDWATVTLLAREKGFLDSLTICGTVRQRDLQAAVAKGRTDLLDLVNEGLAKFSDEERRYFINRWFIEEEEGSFWQSAVMPVAIVLLLSIGVWVWTSRRRR